MPNTKHHLTGHTCGNSPNRPVKAPHAYRPKAATWALRRDRKSPNARRVGPAQLEVEMDPDLMLQLYIETEIFQASVML